MRGIQLKNGCVFYYGNTAGYVEKDTAVMDTMFRSTELEHWLSGRNLNARWIDGVYDRLINGVLPVADENIIPLKACRIWQLRTDVDVMMKFISYSQMAKEFGAPKPEDYEIAYDGQIETNDLEAIVSKFSSSHPHGFTGHPLSMSDIIEFYDMDGSDYFYVDRSGFQQIEFGNPEQSQGMTMSL
jgi:hypothetical protein